MKDDKVEKEPWDSSNKAAESLKISDFGSIEQVRDMARMDRFPKTYAEARLILSKLVNVPFVSGSGLYATLSKNSIKNSIEKILSDTGGIGSHNLKRHLLAAGNLDKLYANAIEPWAFEMNPNKNNASLEDIRRLFAPMEYEGDIAIVKITVKEMKNPKDGSRIYTIKTLDVFLDKKIEDASTLARGS